MKYIRTTVIVLILAFAVLLSLRAIDAKTAGCDSSGLEYVQYPDGTITAVCPVSKRPPLLVEAGDGTVVATCPSPLFGGNPNA